jgi:Xaa-Pro aminopeptidase
LLFNRKEGFGARLENDILAREGGSVDLMETIPNEAEAVEELMGR